MPTNRYHILSFLPAVEGWEMQPALEAQARRLVASGKLRIHTDSARNFARFATADTDATFTLRELTDPKLRRSTRAELARHVPGALGEDGVDALLARADGRAQAQRQHRPRQGDEIRARAGAVGAPLGGRAAAAARHRDPRLLRAQRPPT
ncbi:MAG: DUF2748 family protein [Alphaproteobacteria bacterium]